MDPQVYLEGVGGEKGLAAVGTPVSVVSCVGLLVSLEVPCQQQQREVSPEFSYSSHYRVENKN